MALTVCWSYVPSVAAAAGPFAALSGAWSGSGTIKVASGANERIRCRGTYKVTDNGNSLRQSLRCASDSYRFIVTSDLSHNDGRISGSWSEATAKVGGDVNGRVTGGRINATVLGSAFTASVAIATSGDDQAVSIQPRGKTDVKEVSVRLHKSN